MNRSPSSAIVARARLEVSAGKQGGKKRSSKRRLGCNHSLPVWLLYGWR
jgi:hypothetical protein